MLGESKKEYRQGTVLEVKKDGVWQERDMRIVDGNFINSPYDIRIDGTKLTVLFQGKTTSLQFATGGRSKAPDIKSHRGHSELHYINILPDTDIIVYLMPRSVHYNIVLKSENADHTQKMEAVGDMKIFHKSISMSGVGLNAQRSKRGNELSQALDKTSLRAEYISKLQERDEHKTEFEESGGQEVEPGDIAVSKKVAYTELELPIIQWIADGGTIPDSGDGALYAVLLTDEVTISDRRVWGYGQLSGETIVSDGQALELGNPDKIRIRMQEPSA